MPFDLQHWLDCATRPLPDDIKMDVCEELTAHYEDTYNNYLLNGYAPDAAHTAALADLGDPRMTAAGLRETYRPGSLYRRAALGSIAAPASLILLVPVIMLADTSQINSVSGVIINALFGLILGALSIGGLMIAINALPVLIGFGADFRLPQRMIIGGLIATLPFTVLGSLGRLDPAPTPEVIVLIDPLTIFNTLYGGMPVDGLARLHAAVLGAVVMLVGAGWLLLAHRLRNHTLYSLGGPLRWLCILSGMTLLGTGVGTILWDTGLAALMAGIACVLGAVKAAALTLLFYRAAVDAASSPPLRWD